MKFLQKRRGSLYYAVQQDLIRVCEGQNEQRHFQATVTLKKQRFICSVKSVDCSREKKLNNIIKKYLHSLQRSSLITSRLFSRH